MDLTTSLNSSLFWGKMMAKYRAVFAISYDVEATDISEAEDKAIEKLEEEFGKSFADIILQHFGSNVEKIEQ